MNRFSMVAMLAAVLLSSLSIAAPPAQTADGDAVFGDPDAVVTELYDLVTFDAGTTPDWDRVRSLFIEEAVIVLRTSREKTTVFSLEGFVQDFVDFIERANVEESGFSEKIIRRKTMVLGEMAHILVLYEASIPGSDRPPLQGVDSFSLIHKEGRWRIVAVTNELPTAERPLPPELQE